MSGIRIHIKGNRNTYLNPLVVLELWRERPDVVIIAGYAPTMLLAALYALCTGTPLILSHDAWTQVDLASQSLVYRALRRWIIRRVGAALVASKKGAEFTRAFGLPLERIYVAPLVPAWEPPRDIPTFGEREYDLLWCGTINDHHKGVRFFMSVVRALAAEKPDLRVRVVGDGEDQAWLEGEMRRAQITVQFDGYLQAEQLGASYCSAKLFAFPTRGDAWGLVANEAAQCGTPVLISPHAGAADEFIVDGGGGYVLALEERLWVNCAAALLSNEELWTARSQGALAAAAQLSTDSSAAKIWSALERACRRRVDKS